MTSEPDYPKVLSTDEMDLYISGDRRQVDRLILTSLNRISSALIEHIKREDGVWNSIDDIGGLGGVKVRADFVDSLIRRNNRRAAAWDKIAQSSAVWALMAVLGFVALAVWQHIKDQLRR